MRQYLLWTSGISLLLLFLYYGLNHPVFSGYLHQWFPGLVAFFFLQSILISFIIRMGKRDNWRSPVYALGTVTVRLLTGMFFLIIPMLLKVDGLPNLMIQFSLLYLLYLVFELYVVLANLRQN